jgi:hypothetical protein
VETWSKQWLVRLIVVGTLVIGYFIAYPEDITAVVSPVERVLALSKGVSPWLYGVIAVAILSCTAVRIWGAKPTGNGAVTRGTPVT